METAYVVFDIETGEALTDEMAEHLFSQIEPDKRLKDPAKIEADIEKKKIEVREKAALSAATGSVVAIGWSVYPQVQTESPYAFTVGCRDECSLIEIFFEALRDLKEYDVRFVTYNGRRFDFPFLLARAMLHSIDGSDVFPAFPSRQQHIDMMDVLGGGSLDSWAMALMGHGKSKPSKYAIPEFLENRDWDGLENHVANDVSRLRDLFSRARKAGRLG